MRLQHLHLPHRAPSLYPPYSLASRIQEHLRRRLLDSKDAIAPSSPAPTTTAASPPPGPPPGVTAAQQLPQQRHPPPLPTLLSFTPMPTYTLGRRQSDPLTDHEVTRLTAPLRISHDDRLPRLPVSVLHSPRGGQTTYHGPGQTVLWPVLDLKSAYHKQFTVRCYSRLLEDTTISVLHSLFGLQAFITDDPGVWVSKQNPAKIAALGVHLRRHVTALGTAINVAMPGKEVSSEEMNPWKRIVACGLEGKEVTSVAGEVASVNHDAQLGEALTEEAVSATWARELASRIDVEGVDTVSRERVVALVTDILNESRDATEEEVEYVRRVQRLG